MEREDGKSISTAGMQCGKAPQEDILCLSGKNRCRFSEMFGAITSGILRSTLRRAICLWKCSFCVNRADSRRVTALRGVAPSGRTKQRLSAGREAIPQLKRERNRSADTKRRERKEMKGKKGKKRHAIRTAAAASRWMFL